MSPPRPAFAAALLAGGRSSRMGADKALLDWRGSPLWRVQLGKLMELNPDRLLLSCRREQTLKNVFAEFVFDPPEHHGAADALARCLGTARLPLLALAVDMPAMTEEFLRSLVAEAGDLTRGVVCHTGSHFEPLCALYPATALAPMRKFLEAGNRRLQDLVALLIEKDLMRSRRLNAGELPLFCNTNTPEEYAWTNPAPNGSN